MYYTNYHVYTFAVCMCMCMQKLLKYFDQTSFINDTRPMHSALLVSIQMSADSVPAINTVAAGGKSASNAEAADSCIGSGATGTQRVQL